VSDDVLELNAEELTAIRVSRAHPFKVPAEPTDCVTTLGGPDDEFIRIDDFLTLRDDGALEVRRIILVRAPVVDIAVSIDFAEVAT